MPSYVDDLDVQKQSSFNVQDQAGPELVRLSDPELDEMLAKQLTVLDEDERVDYVLAEYI